MKIFGEIYREGGGNLPRNSRKPSLENIRICIVKVNHKGPAVIEILSYSTDIQKTKNNNFIPVILNKFYNFICLDVFWRENIKTCPAGCLDISSSKHGIKINLRLGFLEERVEVDSTLNFSF